MSTSFLQASSVFMTVSVLLVKKLQLNPRLLWVSKEFSSDINIH